VSLDREGMAKVLATVPKVVRVVIAAHQGSSPREAGAAMLVWADGQSGTIGGGALEHDASAQARAMLARGEGGAMVRRMPLGPALGQCCGGAVTLVFEPFDQQALAALPLSGAYARPVEGGASEMPLGMRNAQRRARGEGVVPVQLLRGWLIEPVAPTRRALWIWGAGHVGRALVDVLHPLPDFALHWVDFAPERFPPAPPPDLMLHHARDPAALVTEAPRTAEHLIVTYSHALDLDLCHRLLRHGFSAAGLIGSASKWARFQSRLRALGHDPRQIARINCPIGDPALGKHPHAIAIGVAQALLSGAGIRTDKELSA
jgi:xanthine dehydrogenase accessory factor